MEILEKENLECYGNGEGCGNGDGNGGGDGYGYGYGDGYGYGYGYGDGNGEGYGNGNGDGKGYGNGGGYGYGSVKIFNTAFHFIHAYFAFVQKCLSAEDIIQHKNAEQKAVLIKEYGYEYIINSLPNKKILDELTEFSSITKKPVHYQVIEFDINNNITARVVSVECTTTHKKTFLGIPRIKQTEKCKGAVAWTFGEEEKDYRLKIET